jgi:uncharacterized membrane-anchored protein
MEHKTTRTERKNYIAFALPKLGDKDQAYIESLTSRLAGTHQTSPEAQVVTGKKAETIVQQKKAQEP